MMFSIIVPVYNVEAYLRRCVESIMEQSYRDFELILVDDGSTDQSPEICDACAEKDERIRVIHKENGGSNSARNQGVFAAKGEYICLVDSDDTVVVNWLETVYDCIQSAPEPPDLIVYGFNVVFEGEIYQRPILIEQGYYDKNRLEAEIYPRLINRDKRECGNALIFEVPWNRVYRKQLIQDHCCREKAIKVSNDMAFVHECVLYANHMVASDALLYNYAIQNQGSLQNSYHPKLLKNYKTLYLYLNARLGSLYPHIPDQLNALLAALIKKGTNHELVHQIPYREAKRHIKTELAATRILDYLRIDKLPFRYRIRMRLLRLHLYGTCLTLQKLMDSIHKRRNK